MSWPVQHVSISINRTPDKVYAYAAKPENLPEWAAGLSGSIRRVGETWVADSPMGQVKIRFAPENSFGILDHDVTLPNGEVVHNPMRVLRNDTESEVVFTLFQRPGMSLENLQSDANQVFEDLLKLKMILEEKD
ncbi:MAG TPA: hypothetical protein VFO10_08730 [Oligoflexus sp.]|uniref:hypothetical protein n=1 Tax=Oligoflexus sp. TaxID=1971216 RepID=UPI002D7EE7BE|nr:hypothetical protein [Oligoflexus sp.]HET9237323.1 hypothetical protein [Oligoflexus sp.]